MNVSWPRGNKTGDHAVTVANSLNIDGMIIFPIYIFIRVQVWGTVNCPNFVGQTKFAKETFPGGVNVDAKLVVVHFQYTSRHPPNCPSYCITTLIHAATNVCVQPVCRKYTPDAMTIALYCAQLYTQSQIIGHWQDMILRHSPQRHSPQRQSPQVNHPRRQSPQTTIIPHDNYPRRQLPQTTITPDDINPMRH